MTAKQLANQFWEIYLDTPRTTLQDEVNAWNNYQAELNKHNIYPRNCKSPPVP